MSNLAVQVQVAGAAGTGLTASVWPAGSFWAPPPGRGTIVPATSPTATGTTDGSGDVTLTGLSSVNYWLVVVDARSVTNWFFVSAPYVGGGTYQANIPWSTPTSVTSPVDVRGGDTLGPNGNTSKGPWCPLLHVHEIPAAPVAAGGMTLIQDINLVVNTLTLDFPSIPSTYKHLKLIGAIASDDAAWGNQLGRQLWDSVQWRH